MLLQHSIDSAPMALNFRPIKFRRSPWRVFVRSLRLFLRWRNYADHEIRSFVVSSLGSLASADDDFSKEIFKATPLSATLYMLEGAGGNITASIGVDGVLLVDCDFAEMSEKLVAKLKELKGGSPRFIINTH